MLLFAERPASVYQADVEGELRGRGWVAWPIGAHVMQHCHGAPLLADHQVGDALARIEAQSSSAFQELRLYHQSQRRDEIEARLVQGMPPALQSVEALFRGASVPKSLWAGDGGPPHICNHRCPHLDLP